MKNDTSSHDPFGVGKLKPGENLLGRHTYRSGVRPPHGLPGSSVIESPINATRPITPEIIRTLRQQEVAQIKDIKPDEEKHLYEMIEKGNPVQKALARNRLIEGHIKATIKRASKYPYDSLDDQNENISIALLALVEAGHKFDPRRGNKFMTLADTYAKNALDIENRIMRGELPLSTQAAKGSHREANRDDENLEDQQGREGPPLSQRKITANYLPATSGTTLHGKSVGGISKGTTTPDERAELERLAQKDLSGAVERLVQDKLTDRQQQVIRPLYGIGEEQQDIKVIAKRLNLTTQTVGQYRDEVLRKLRKDPRTWQIFDKYLTTARIAELGSCKVCQRDNRAMSKGHPGVCMGCVFRAYTIRGTRPPKPKFNEEEHKFVYDESTRQPRLSIGEMKELLK